MRAARDPASPAVVWGRPPPLPAGSAAWSRGCSSVHRLCVRASPAIVPRTAAAALAALDRAWDALVEVVRAPAPEGLAGEPWDAFVLDGEPRASGAFLAGRDPRSRFDRGGSFGIVHVSAPIGCPLDRAAARAVARASIWRAAPAMDDASAIAQAEALADLATPCGRDDDSEGDAVAFQATPERSIADPTSTAFARGAGRFYAWLDGRFGIDPGALLVGAWALSPTRTPRDDWRAGRWASSPSEFDVFRKSLAGALWKGSTLDDIVGQFAVARASPPTAPPDPTAAWRIPWPEHPRRLASALPVAPTGASYVVVDVAGARPGARLQLEAHWEDYGRMRWAAIKADAVGNALQSIPIAAGDRATSAALTLEGLDGIDRVIVVGANVGSTEHPFRPDQREWEPHGWTLTVGAE